MEKKKEGKVLMILNEYRLVIDLGEQDVTVGSIVSVIDSSVPIIDLEGKELGVYTFQKAELRVTEVHPQYSICFSNEKTKQGGFTMLATAALQERTVIAPLTVNANENLDIKVKEREISKGDKVIIVE